MLWFLFCNWWNHANNFWQQHKPKNWRKKKQKTRNLHDSWLATAKVLMWFRLLLVLVRHYLEAWQRVIRENETKIRVHILENWHLALKRRNKWNCIEEQKQKKRNRTTSIYGLMKLSEIILTNLVQILSIHFVTNAQIIYSTHTFCYERTFSSVSLSIDANILACLKLWVSQ